MENIIREQMISTYDIMSAEMEQELPVDVIYAYFAKTFDKVPHRRLLLKLHAYGIRDQLLGWIGDWLSGRKQRVHLGMVSGNQRSSTRLCTGTASFCRFYK